MPTSGRHVRHNHDGRRHGKVITGTVNTRNPVDNDPRPPVNVGDDDDSSSASTYAETTGTDKTSESVSIPASLIEQEQAAESQNQEYPVVQEVTPPRPLGL